MRCFAESATGIRSGGRTGLTALMVSFWFFVALWFTPIIGEPGCLTLKSTLLLSEHVLFCWQCILVQETITLGVKAWEWHYIYQTASKAVLKRHSVDNVSRDILCPELMPDSVLVHRAKMWYFAVQRAFLCTVRARPLS